MTTHNNQPGRLPRKYNFLRSGLRPYTIIPNHSITCSICLEETTWIRIYPSTSAITPEPPEQYDKFVRISRCGHVFHDACLRSWFDEQKNTCPICRKELFRMPTQVQEQSRSVGLGEMQDLNPLGAWASAGLTISGRYLMGP
jgi:hypothetical protein